MESTLGKLSQTQLTLYLITEELKTRKFFNGLLDLGLDNCPYQPNLDKLIMAYIGLPDDVDDAFDFYYDVIDWVGGYPYEYASRDEIKNFVEKKEYKLIKFNKAKVPTGCNEFIFEKL